MEDEIVNTVCGICDSGCLVTVQVREGILLRVLPRAKNPHTGCCPRGMNAPEIVYSPDRVCYPQKRVGPKGTDAFQRITWDEAYDFLVRRLREVAGHYGPKAVCMYTGRGNFEQSLCDIYAPAGTAESSASSVLFPFGSPNTTGVGSICYVAHAMIAPQTTVGAYKKDMFNDFDHTELIVVWGANPAGVAPITLRPIRRAQRRGAQVVVIDHRRSQTAKATDGRWIGIRPGTDGALALSMIQVLVEENLYDQEFVQHWTQGFDELRDYVQRFRPEVAEAITRVPAETIRELTRSIALARGATLVSYSGLEYTNSGVQNIRATFILWALAGQLDVPGGLVFKMPGTDFPVHRAQVPPPADVDPVGKDEYPLYHHFRREAHAMTLPEAILEGKPYPVRAMVIGGSSILTSYPQPALWQRCFEALDFLVVINRFPTADALYADLLLPATTMYEIESYQVHGHRIHHRPRAIRPQGEARNDYLIFAELAGRLGYGHLYPQSEEDLLRFVLRGTGVSVQELRQATEGVARPVPEMAYRKWERGLLRADRQPGFGTPSGKLEIASTLLLQHGYDALPVYIEPVEGPLATPELAEIYPLVFNSGARTQFNFRSQHHNIPGLVKKQPEPLVMLNPQDAAIRGIEDGCRVWVVSPRGKVPVTARVTEDILPGVVEVSAGGGSPVAVESWRWANVNALTDMNNRDPISGFPVYKALLCDVVRGGISPQEALPTR